MIKTVALCLIKVPLTVCVMWRVDIDHWGKFQGCTLLNKSTIRGKIRVARLDVYTGLCQTQSNYSITLHVEKLIYVNIYPPKCFYSVVPLKTCSSTQLKTIFWFFLYTRKVSLVIFCCTTENSSLNFTDDLIPTISYLVTKIAKKVVI